MHAGPGPVSRGVLRGWDEGRAAGGGGRGGTHEMGTPAAWKGPAMAKAKAPAPALALAAAPGGPARADGPHPGGVVPLLLLWLLSLGTLRSPCCWGAGADRHRRRVANGLEAGRKAISDYSGFVTGTHGVSAHSSSPTGALLLL